MRVFAISDLHVDFDANARWVSNLSSSDFTDDVLILAGDVSDRLDRISWCVSILATRFRHLLFVPGNHDLWVLRDRRRCSWHKYQEVRRAVHASGGSLQPFYGNDVTIVPLLGWYDYSFGVPSTALQAIWADYQACQWPEGATVHEIASEFARLNPREVASRPGTVVTFSHFLPRADLMTGWGGSLTKTLLPVLGSSLLEVQLRRLQATIHVYGHSHVSRSLTRDGVLYINSAFGYPHETGFAARRLCCIHQS